MKKEIIKDMLQYRRPISKRSIFLSFVVSAAYLCLLYTIFSPRWETNDDVGMSMAAHGYGIAAFGSPKIIFSNVKERHSSREKLIGFAQSYSLFYDIINSAGGCPVINAGVDSDDGHKDILKRVNEFISMWQNSIDKIIKEGIKNGEFKKTNEITDFSNIFIALIEGGILLSKIKNDRKYIDNASAYLVSLIEKMGE